MGHSEIGASSAHRWINCPGSVRLYRRLTERKSSIYADIGTAAHELAEGSLLTGNEPSDCLGDKCVINGNEIIIDEAMVNSVQVYVDKIRADKSTFGGELKVEQPFSLEWLYPDMFGRNDACLVPTELFGTLRVYDYKNGSKKVFAKDNVQMMYYALGALGEHNLSMAETVVQTIVQPNAWGKAPIDEWELSVKELYEWGHDVLKVAAQRTQEADAPCVTGDWCQFCEAAHMCQARADEALAKLEPPKEAGEVMAHLPDSKGIPPEKLGLLVSFFTSDRFKDWVKAITAEEMSLLARGIHVPGRKIIEVESKGNRKWADESKVQAAFSQYGGEIFETKLKSPTQLEAFLKKLRISPADRTAMIEPLVTREVKVNTLVVDESDNRLSIAEKQKEAIDLL